MNGRRLLVTFLLLLGAGLVLNSRGTMTPEFSAEHVFYGGESHFLGQQIAVGDFNNDTYDDIVSAVYWDDPTPGGAPLVQHNSGVACFFEWEKFVAESSGVYRTVCKFTDVDVHERHWAYWESIGWEGDPESATSCGTCYEYQDLNENQGALHVLDGDDDWSGVGEDVDLASGTLDHFIKGKAPGDLLHAGLAAGNVNGDSYDDLIAGSTTANGSGEVYVINGGSSWPGTINLASPGGVLGHTLIGRDDTDVNGHGDSFGAGIAVGDLDDDGDDDIVVAAPGGDGQSGAARLNSGEVYIFYTSEGIPSTADLSGLSDSAVDALDYVTVVYGPSVGASLGVTHISNFHGSHQGTLAHGGGYDPVGLAIGDWNGDGYNDLAIGTGLAESLDGAVYVIFGNDPDALGAKLTPSNNRIDLNISPSSSLDAPDMKITGKTDSRLGAGIAFVDADDQGLGASVKSDLIIGGPLATSGGETERGEAYIIFGDTKANLVATSTRNVATSGHVDVTIVGEEAGDRFGSQFEGNQDIDDDDVNDIGATGEAEQYVFFVESGGSWDSVVDMQGIDDDSPETRMIKMADVHSGSSYAAHSVTIRFADTDGDNYRDLVFGGYDTPGAPGSDAGLVHAGQMWITKGDDIWKHGYISANTTWSGNVFLNGDVVVQSGQTLTLEAGTDVWVWSSDTAGNIDGVSGRVSIIVASGGALVVEGTEEDPVRIQAWSLEIADEAVSEWGGIVMQDGAALSTIEHALIRNGDFGVVTASDLIIKNTTIEDCYSIGVAVAGSGVAQTDSVYMEDVVIRGLTATGSYGVYITGNQASARAEGCWVRDCSIGLLVDDEGAWESVGLHVRDTSDAGASITEDSEATFSGGRLESDGMALKLTDGAVVYAGLTEFKYGEYGIYIEKDGSSLPSAEFAECLIDSNATGVHVSESDDIEFDECEVRRNDGDGISCVAGADITVLNCIIAANDASGIRTDNSDPDIDGNLIQTNNGGITCENYANPIVHSNKVWDNINGIAFVDDAIAIMDQCGGSCPPCGDSNSFKGNTGYHFSNLTSTTIDAECNYWGKTTPSAAKFYGPVDYTPYLSSDPLPVAQQPDTPGADARLPKAFRLTGNAPNPFNPVTTIRYEVPAPGGRVQLRVYNVQGQLVRTLVNEQIPAGFHSVTWGGVNESGSDVSSGVYFLQMLAPNFRATSKIVLLK